MCRSGAAGDCLAGVLAWGGRAGGRTLAQGEAGRSGLPLLLGLAARSEGPGPCQVGKESPAAPPVRASSCHRGHRPVAGRDPHARSAPATRPARPRPPPQPGRPPPTGPRSRPAARRRGCAGPSRSGRPCRTRTGTRRMLRAVRAPGAAGTWTGPVSEQTAGRMPPGRRRPPTVPTGSAAWRRRRTRRRRRPGCPRLAGRGGSRRRSPATRRGPAHRSGRGGLAGPRAANGSGPVMDGPPARTRRPAPPGSRRPGPGSFFRRGGRDDHGGRQAGWGRREREW